MYVRATGVTLGNKLGYSPIHRRHDHCLLFLLFLFGIVRKSHVPFTCYPVVHSNSSPNLIAYICEKYKTFTNVCLLIRSPYLTPNKTQCIPCTRSCAYNPCAPTCPMAQQLSVCIRHLCHMLVAWKHTRRE